MADEKISALPSGSPAQSTDLVAVARAGSDYRLAIEDLSAAAAAASTLAGLADVTFTSLTNGQGIAYNSGISKWVNYTIPPPGSSTLAGDTDVSLSALVNGQFLTYSSVAGKWINSATAISTALATCTDVDLTSLIDGELLVYDATTSKWINRVAGYLPTTGGTITGSLGVDGVLYDSTGATGSAGQVLTVNAGATGTLWASGATGSTGATGATGATGSGSTGATGATGATGGGTLAGDSDVDIVSPADGDLLTYDSGTSKWVNLPLDEGVSVNPQTSSNYTTVLGDANQLVTLSYATACTFTIPTNASVAYPTGTTLSVIQLGTGQITLTPASDAVTIDTPSSLTSRAQYSTIAVAQVSANVWVATGDLT